MLYLGGKIHKNFATLIDKISCKWYLSPQASRKWHCLRLKPGTLNFIILIVTVYIPCYKTFRSINERISFNSFLYLVEKLIFCEFIYIIFWIIKWIYLLIYLDSTNNFYLPYDQCRLAILWLVVIEDML